MKNARGGSKPIHSTALKLWPVMLTEGQQRSIQRKAEELHSSKAAVARAAINKGLLLITAADVLQESR